ncbi:hypothetical protein SUDANB51_04112 [Streptomyces sp. enrichment culture]
MVGAMVMWAGGVTVGWALVHWPHLTEGFTFSSSLEPAEHSGPVDALYISLVIVATLGLGDIAPRRAGCASSHPSKPWWASCC